MEEDTIHEFDGSESTVTCLNRRCELHNEQGVIVVFVDGAPWMSFDKNDVSATRLAMVQLAERRVATQMQIARGFKQHENAVTRYIKAYRQGGVEALVPKRRGPKGPRIAGGRMERVIVAAKRAGQSERSIAAKLGIGRTSVGKVLKRVGWRDEDRQHTLPLNSETSGIEASIEFEPEAVGFEPEVVEFEPEVVEFEPEAVEFEPEAVEFEPEAVEFEPEAAPREQSAGEIERDEPTEVPAQFSADTDPSNRNVDRLLARMGLLDDAAPLFETAENVRDAGVLLAIPVLVQSGVFYDGLRVFGSIGPAFYGVRNSLVCLCLLMMLNLCRLQDVMRREPGDLGRLIGLDRSPELKTLRGKLKTLVRKNKSLVFMDALAARQLRREQGRLWTYLDGHVEVYTGKRKFRLHHVTRLRTARPSMLDYWVNQPDGAPLLVVTGTQEEGLVKQIPQRVNQLKNMAPGREVTIIFDREGWSPKLFSELKSMPGVHFMTYRKKGKKGKKLPRLAAHLFQRYCWEANGQCKDYELADTRVRIPYRNGKQLCTVQLRQITRRKADGKQTHILTDDESTSVAELAHRMFSRWGQENYLKYGRQHRDLDALVTYGTESVDGSRLVDNPKRKQVQDKLKKLEDKLDQFCQDHGKLLAGGHEPDEVVFRADAQKMQAVIARLKTKRNALPTKVALRDTEQGKDIVQPRTESRRLMHVFRIVAHRSETALLELMRPNFKDWRHEGRDLIRDVLHSSGNLRVTDAQLIVEVKPQSSPYKTRALIALCDELTRLETTFPGTNLKLAFTIAPARSSPP